MIALSLSTHKVPLLHINLLEGLFRVAEKLPWQA